MITCISSAGRRQPMMSKRWCHGNEQCWWLHPPSGAS